VEEDWNGLWVWREDLDGYGGGMSISFIRRRTDLSKGLKTITFVSEARLILNFLKMKVRYAPYGRDEECSFTRVI